MHGLPALLLLNCGSKKRRPGGQEKSLTHKKMQRCSAGTARSRSSHPQPGGRVTKYGQKARHPAHNCLERAFAMSGGNEAAAASVTERASCQGFLQKHGGFILGKVAGTSNQHRFLLAHKCLLLFIIFPGMSTVLFDRRPAIFRNFDTLFSGRSDTTSSRGPS